MNPGDVSVPPSADGAEERLEILRRWWRLPAPARREVRLLGRSGRHHPDREVAWVAWRWAQVVLPPGAPEPGRARNLLSAAGFWVQVLLELGLGGDPTDPPEPRWLDRRQARRILRAGPPVA